MFTIGQLSKASNTPITTVRFYERSGLLKPTARTAANYRTYDSASLERIRFIRSAQATGLSLGDISELLDLMYSRRGRCESVCNVLKSRLTELRQHIQQLHACENLLASALADCEHGENAGLCRSIESLTEKKSAKPA